MSGRPIRHPATSELELATILRTVGDPVRLAIVQHLGDGRERTCGQLAADFAMPASTLSYHLRLLREAGVTRSRAAGTERLTRLREEDLDARFPGLLTLLRRQPREPVGA